MESKDDVRNQLLSVRKSMNPNEVVILSERVIERLMGVKKVNGAVCIFVYVSTGNEVNTHNFIKMLLSQGKTVLVPHVVDGKMAACKLNSWDQLELKDGFLVPNTTICDIAPDVCIAPGAGFSEDRERIGRGCGHYDGYLEGKSIFTIGLGFENQVVQELPTEPHDKKMDMIITDKRII